MPKWETIRGKKTKKMQLKLLKTLSCYYGVPGEDARRNLKIWDSSMITSTRNICIPPCVQLIRATAFFTRMTKKKCIWIELAMQNQSLQLSYASAIRRTTVSRSAKSIFLPISSGSFSVSSSSQTKRWKITRKDLRLHKLVFEEDGLPDRTALTYSVCGLKVIEGYNKALGIFCYHCNSEEFGDCLCCDMCPRAFHQDCVGLSSIPEDKWSCPFCVNMYESEKCCEYNANAVAAEKVSGVDPIEQITQRCIHVVETNGAICRLQTFSTEFGPNTVIICDQGEKNYQVGCLPY